MNARLLLFSIVALTSVVRAAEKPEIWMEVDDSDSAAAYSSAVEAKGMNGYYGVGFQCAQKAGDWATFRFTGTGVKWIGGKNVDHPGSVDVFIDGKFDSNVSSHADSWQKQQEIFVKTGLPDGPHVLKLVLKADGYQDFDAFAYLGPAPRAAAMPKIKGLTLPPQAPLLNPTHRYPVGNGVAVIVSNPTGQIHQAFGPGYTTSDLVHSEDPLLEVDGTEQPLRVPMMRATGTGVFYGFAAAGDLDVFMADYACAGQPWISRLFVLKNVGKTAHTVVLRDGIAPFTDNGYKHAVISDEAGHPNGVSITADTGAGVPFGGNNPVDKSVLIAFDDAASTAFADGQGLSLQTKPMKLAPGEQVEVTLTHYFRAGHEMADSAALGAIRGLDNKAELQKSIHEWQAWLNDVKPEYALAKVKEDRARTLLEGALVVLKNNVSQDGGMVAHTTFYKEGYIRDAAMGMRGLLACGHTEEAKNWLKWCDKKFSVHHHFGDAMNCDVSLDVKSNSFDMGNMDVEEPGWILLVARDYFAQTHDLDFLKSIDRTLRYCADTQLKQAAANDYKMEFNGDETEICGAVDVGSTGVHPGGDAPKFDWSLSSVAMAAASLNFYADYLKAGGGDPTAYHNGITNTTVNLDTEMKNMVSAMDRDFWRTDVAGATDGFHDYFLGKDGLKPKARVVNFTLMPVFFSTAYAPEEKTKDVAAMAALFDSKNGFMQLVPSAANGMEGHDLGYLLWGCVETNDSHKDAVYSALVNGRTVDCWGSFCEAYNSVGDANDHDLRSLETGINVSALAKYWSLGK